MYSVAARLEAFCTQDDSCKLEGALHGYHRFDVKSECYEQKYILYT